MAPNFGDQNFQNKKSWHDSALQNNWLLSFKFRYDYQGVSHFKRERFRLGNRVDNLKWKGFCEYHVDSNEILKLNLYYWCHTFFLFFTYPMATSLLKYALSESSENDGFSPSFMYRPIFCNEKARVNCTATTALFLFVFYRVGWCLYSNSKARKFYNKMSISYHTGWCCKQTGTKSIYTIYSFRKLHYFKRNVRR